MKYPEHTFILTWNLDYDDWTFTEWENDMRKLNEVIRQRDIRHSLCHPDAVDYCATSLRASLNNWKGAKAGDRFFMYLISETLGFKKRLVGSGFFYDEPHLVEGLWSSPKNGAAYTVHLDFDVMLNPRAEYDLLTQQSLELQFPDYDWDGGTPDFMVDERTAWMLEEKWYYLLTSLDLKCEGSDFWCRSKDGFYSMNQWEDYRSKGHSYDISIAFSYMGNLGAHEKRKNHSIEEIKQELKELLRQKQEQESNENNE